MKKKEIAFIMVVNIVESVNNVFDNEVWKDKIF